MPSPKAIETLFSIGSTSCAQTFVSSRSARHAFRSFRPYPGHRVRVENVGRKEDPRGGLVQLCGPAFQTCPSTVSCLESVGWMCRDAEAKDDKPGSFVPSNNQKKQRRKVSQVCIVKEGFGK